MGTLHFLPRVALFAIAVSAAGQITVDYPAEGSVFPPDFAPPTFVWRDATTATSWRVEVSGAAKLGPFRSRGERMSLGEIDPRTVSVTNAPPKLTPKQAAGHTWRPDVATWAAMQGQSHSAPVVISIRGYAGNAAVSKGQVRISFSSDPVGAPIFYRDVPLMPSATEKGIIKPLAQSAIPLINWRLRDLRESGSKVVMTGIHTCANCHSFSSDGKTMGLDVDGPQNDKGLYAVLPVSKQMSIDSDKVVAWSTFRGKLGGKLRVGFMSQVSPDGKYVATMINEPGTDESEYKRRKSATEVATNYYVANFRDYRFLQVFYPTRGIIAWYSRDTGKLQPLPGADDPRYVQTNAVWSPDGKYLVFARADAQTPYSGGKMAAFANDPLETQIRYDLYRVPFNDGRGGAAEPIAGASSNGASNSFPRVSPNGKWIVFVKAKNGLLMRPDSELWIVPAAGGEARRMRCNTPLMNSWHSFSPNGKWMVFSSKSRSSYTEMFLTHVDENGNDTPPILVENSKAANRAINLPEFVNIEPDGMENIDPVVTRYYSVIDGATELMNAHKYEASITEWRRAIELNPDEALAHNNLGYCLAELGRTGEAVTAYEKAIQLSPEYPEAHNNLGSALVSARRLDEAIAQFERALELKPDYGSAHSNLGAALAQQNRLPEAIEHFRAGVTLMPENVDTRNNLGVSLAMLGQWQAAATELEKAVQLSGGREPLILDLLGIAYAQTGQFPKAVAAVKRAIGAAKDPRMAQAFAAKLQAYQAGRLP